MSLRKISLETKAFEDLLYWLRNDRKSLERIMDLIDEIQRSPFDGKGKPELLRHNLKGQWARRITEEHRLVYRVSEDEITILSCRFHYQK